LNRASSSNCRFCQAGRQPGRSANGQVIADALVGAFAHHYRCELAGDAELLQRIRHPPGDALEILVASGAVPPGDALPAGLMILSALAGFCRSSSPSVLQRAA
jgi:hypothetical protein